jgi:hypothetical protein
MGTRRRGLAGERAAFLTLNRVGKGVALSWKPVGSSVVFLLRLIPPFFRISKTWAVINSFRSLGLERNI